MADPPRIEALSSVMGACVKPIDLRQGPEPAAFEAIKQALERHLLLVVPDQDLEPERMVAVSRLFGELEVHVLSAYHLPGFPEIYHLSNVGARGEIKGGHPDKGTLVWHSDLSFKTVPASMTLLHGREVPNKGADTVYANMHSAYDALSGRMKRRIKRLKAVHDLAYSRRRAGVSEDMSELERRTPPVAHPLVRRHPETGRPSLYVGHHCSRIEGMGEQEGRLLLDELIDHATRPEFCYVHTWSRGDLVIWDNRSTLHRATPFDTMHARRVMYRTVVAGQTVEGFA